MCIVDCNYTIEVYSSNYYRMELQEEVLLGFGKDDQSVMAEIEIPETLTYTDIKIIAVVNNPESVNGSLSLFASLAPKKPTEDKHDFKGEPVWGDGQGIFIPKDKIPPKSKLRILLSGSKDMEIAVTCFSVSSNTRRIYPGQSIYDDVDTNKSKVYIL